MMDQPRRATLRPYLQTCILILAALVAYFPTFHNGFIWDDDHYIQGNEHLLTVHGLRNIWFHIGSEPQYYPLTHTTFWLEYHAFGANPLIYHVDNWLLHVIGAIVLWRLLRRLAIPGCFLAALIFCVHPVQTESVAWATERKNVLSGLLYLLAFSAYLRFDGENRNWNWYVFSLILFVSVLLAKSVTSTLPAAILILIWYQRGRIRLRDIFPLLPMFVAGAAMGLLTRWMELHVVGAIGPNYPSNFLQRICLAGRAPWFYLGKLIWPVKLTFIYPRWNIDPHRQPVILLFPAALFALGIALGLLRRQIGRGPLAAFLFFIVTLGPALGFANFFPMRYSYVADHFQYLACIGPISLFAAMGRRLLKPPIRGAGAAVIVIILCVVTNAQCRIYFDSLRLWRDTLAKNPDAWMAHENYGQALQESGDLAGAENEYAIVMRLHPREPTVYIKLGVCAAIRGDYPKAIQLFNQSLRQMPDSPEPVLHRIRSEPYYRIGWVYGVMADQALAKAIPDSNLARQDRQLAIEAYRQAIQINPQYELAMVNLGAVLLADGKTEEAIDELRHAISINPDSVRAHDDLGDALFAQGKNDEAIEEYQQVLRIQPQNVHAINNIGAVYVRQQKWAQAIAQFQLALQIDPDFELARRNLTNALAHQ